MKFKPLHDWALIQRMDADERTSGGIIIPDAAKEKPAEGIIIAIGPGRNMPDKKDKDKKVFVPTSLRPGDRVIYAKYMVTEIEMDGEEITLVREEDILATVEGSGELAVKKDYAVKHKEAQPLAVKQTGAIAKVASDKKAATGKKAVKKKSKTKKKAAPKRSVKKKTAKKAAPKSSKKKAKKKVAGKKVKKTKKTASKKKKTLKHR